MKTLNIKTTTIFNYKYIVKIKNKKFEILSNLQYEKFSYVLESLTEKIEGIDDEVYILDCYEFEYTDENLGMTLDELPNYL